MTAPIDRARSRIVLLGGGIGAGKSKVASLFADRGFAIVEADAIGRSVLEPGSPSVAEVAQRWPDAVSDGVVDRQALAGIVFSEPAALEQLEAITHPEIGRRIVEAIDSATAPVVVEIPVMKVLSEGPYLRVAVIADAGVREDRAVERGNNRDDVRRRMSNQPSDEEWLAWADRSVDNSGAWDQTVEAVEALIDEVLGDV